MNQVKVTIDASHLPVRQPRMRSTAGYANRADRGRIVTLAARYAVVASHCIALHCGLPLSGALAQSMSLISRWGRRGAGDILSEPNDTASHKWRSCTAVGAEENHI
jgi:hypothetical protein